MNRTIASKRLYSLGDYKNVTFEDVIEGLPEDVMMNHELVGKLRYLQLIEMEIMLNKYLELYKTFKNKSPEEIIKLLEETRIQLLDSIKYILNGKLSTQTNIKLEKEN
jgi:hypothetical protein